MNGDQSSKFQDPHFFQEKYFSLFQLQKFILQAQIHQWQYDLKSFISVHWKINYVMIYIAGKQPLVIARGGFSGLFPESSSFANQMALSLSLQDTVLFCNLQLTKDGIGICLSDIRLDNSTNIALVYPKGQKTYDVNGNQVHGWFALDYTIDQLFNNVSRKSQTPCLSSISCYFTLTYGFTPLVHNASFWNNNINGMEYLKFSIGK